MIHKEEMPVYSNSKGGFVYTIKAVLRGKSRTQTLQRNLPCQKKKHAALFEIHIEPETMTSPKENSCPTSITIIFQVRCECQGKVFVLLGIL